MRKSPITHEAHKALRAQAQSANQGVDAMTLPEALQAVITAAERSTSYYLQCAASYALSARRMTPQALRYHIPYILNNIQYWRGEEARAVRQTLREFLLRKDLK